MKLISDKADTNELILFLSAKLFVPYQGQLIVKGVVHIFPFTFKSIQDLRATDCPEQD